MACRVEFFFFLVLVCLFLLLQNLWKLSPCVCPWCGNVWKSVRVKLTGPQSRLTGKTSPPLNILNVTVPMVTSFQPPPFLCPACLFWRVTFACLKLSHSPGALSSVGGLTIGYHFQKIKSNLTPQIYVTTGWNASAKAHLDCSRHFKHCSKPGQLFPQIYFMCGVLLLALSTSLHRLAGCWQAGKWENLMVIC